MSATPYPSQQTTQQPQTIIVQNPEKEYSSFAVNKAVSTGGTQLALGVLAIIFQISATAIEAEHGSAAGGIWAGFVFLVAGCIGLTARSRKSCCKITTYGVFSLLAFLCAVALLILASLGVQDDKEAKDDVCWWEDQKPDWDKDHSDDGDCEGNCWSDECGRYNARIAMNVMLIIFAVIEMIVSFYAMIICLRGCCGGKKPKQRTLPTVASNGQAVVVYPSDNVPRQYIAYPQAPAAQPIAPPAYEEATAPPAYVYYAADAVQASAPSGQQDSYTNATYEVDPPDNIYAKPDKN